MAFFVAEKSVALMDSYVVDSLVCLEVVDWMGSMMAFQKVVNLGNK